MAWQTDVRLFNPILSKPTKLDWEAVRMAPANIVMGKIAISDEDSGLWNNAEAIKLEIETKIIVNINPIATSKTMPATTTSRVRSSLF